MGDALTSRDLIEIGDGKGLGRAAEALPLPITKDLHPLLGRAHHLTECCHNTAGGHLWGGCQGDPFCATDQPRDTSLQDEHVGI